jgi:far upstream element-binding protein
MHVPANKTGLVIGKGGDTIKQICGETGAHVELSRDPMPNANEKVFIIRGTPYQIHHVQHIIRIKVGDIQPGTPLPPFGGAQGMPASNPYGPTQFGTGADFGGGAQWGQNGESGGQDASAWAQYYSQQQAGYATAAQPGFPAQTQPYQAQGIPAQQGQQATGGQQPIVSGNATGGNGAPSINPQTGQPDYSAQWVEYYRSMNMHEQANVIEAQMKQAAGGQSGQARPQQQQVGGYGYNS